MRTKMIRGLAGTASAIVMAFGVLAEPTASHAAPAGFATVRAAHFSPDTPGVDIYLTSFAGGTTRLWVPNAEYGGVSPYQRVSPGLYVVSMRLHGAAVSSKPAISWNLDLRAGGVYTTAAVGANKALKTVVLHDDLTPPPAGKARIRVVQGASRAPRANIDVSGGGSVAKDLSFATSTGYSTITPGFLPLHAQSVSSSAVTASARLAVQAGTISSVLLLDAPGGGITLKSVLDAAGASVMPVGAVPAGGGGMADELAPRGHNRSPLQFALVGAVVGALFGLCWRGRRRPAVSTLP